MFKFNNKDIKNDAKGMIQRSFEVCSIIRKNQGLLRHDNFLKRIMANVEVDSNQSDNDGMFKGLFEN